MSGAFVAAAKAAYGRERRIQSPRALRLPPTATRTTCGARRSNPVREAGTRTDNTPLHTGGLIATLPWAAPARCGACLDERRIGRLSTSAHVPRHVGRRGARRPARVRTDDAYVTLASSTHLPLRRAPRVAARSPMRDVSLRATAAALCGHATLTQFHWAHGSERCCAHVPPPTCHPSRAAGRRQACASLVASFAAGVRVGR